jgi:hypothetical protein
MWGGEGGHMLEDEMEGGCKDLEPSCYILPAPFRPLGHIW